MTKRPKRRVQSTSPAVATTAPPGINSWAFWKRRLARVAIIGGLALLATKVFPALPTDQHVLVVAPTGYKLRDVSLSYADLSSGQLLGAAQLRPSDANPTTVSHKIRLSNGDYKLIVSSEVNTFDGKPAFLNQIQDTHLDGSTQRIKLSAP